MKQCSPDIVGVLQSVHSALDEALGDTDVSHIENDDELREEHPVQWAAFWLAHVIEELPALLQPARLSAVIGEPVAWRWRYQRLAQMKWLVTDTEPKNPDGDIDIQPLYVDAAQGAIDPAQEARNLDAVIKYINETSAKFFEPSHVVSCIAFVRDRMQKASMVTSTEGK